MNRVDAFDLASDHADGALGVGEWKGVRAQELEREGAGCDHLECSIDRRVIVTAHALQAHLRANGIETLIHYPVALNHQPAFAAYRPADCPVAAAATGELLSLPLHPRVLPAQVDQVAACIGAWRG